MQTPLRSLFRFGPFQVNSATGELLKNGNRIKLQEQPFRLLVALLENAGELVTREELRHRIWRDDTFVDFDSSLRVAVRKLREALGDDAENPRYVETIPKRGYRFLAPDIYPDSAIRHAAASNGSSPAAGMAAAGGEADGTSTAHASKRSRTWIVAPLLLLIGIASAWFVFHVSRVPKPLTEKDTIVLADFANTTGDPAFDGTLKQALAVDLDQSPFLRVLSPARVRKALIFMGRSPDERLTSDVSRDLCLRVGSKAMLSGSIASLGRQYVLTLNAVNCQSGDSLAQQQEEASSKEQVLSALGSAASKLRGTLGESLASVEKFDVPIEQVTTTSLDALKAFALGNAEFDRGRELESLPFYRQAVELDPNFAWVYARMANAYRNYGELEQAKEYTRKAYQRKDRVSEREKLYITKNYYLMVTGELDKAIETLDLYERTYPSDEIPGVNLSLCYRQIGDFEKAAEAARRSLLAGPNSANSYINLALAEAALGQPDRAQQSIEQALKQFPDSAYIQWISLWLAFALEKPDEAQRLLAWARGRPGEFKFLRVQVSAFESEGKLRLSSDLTQRLLEMERDQNLKEVESSDLGQLALVQADFGRCDQARKNIAILRTSKTQDAAVFAALVFATCGEGAKANAAASELARKYPLDTLTQKVSIPQIRARVELEHGNGARAIEQLRPAETYQFGYVAAGMPVYLRGRAYLQTRQGSQAVTEFQKILDHKSALGASPYVSLARLGLARGFALSGDPAKARAAFDDFFSKWKDADPDLPILKQAKAEYARLQ